MASFGPRVMVTFTFFKSFIFKSFISAIGWHIEDLLKFQIMLVRVRGLAGWLPGKFSRDALAINSTTSLGIQLKQGIYSVPSVPQSPRKSNSFSEDTTENMTNLQRNISSWFESMRGSSPSGCGGFFTFLLIGTQKSRIEEIDPALK